jgi:YjbE family integral membrane protein
MIEMIENSTLGVAYAKVVTDMAAPGFWLGVMQIIWIDILLAGDNAVIIALACRKLPKRQQIWGLILGSGVGVLLRVIFALGVAALMGLPYVKLIGGAALLYIAVKLLQTDDDEEHVKSGDRLWNAVAIIVVADVVMSLDNVIAIAAVSDGQASLLIFGVAASVPLILAGSRALMWVIDRFPVVIMAGAVLLGWIAGKVIATDSVTISLISRWGHADALHTTEMVLAVVGAASILVTALVMRGREKEDAA